MQLIKTSEQKKGQKKEKDRKRKKRDRKKVNKNMIAKQKFWWYVLGFVYPFITVHVNFVLDVILHFNEEVLVGYWKHIEELRFGYISENRFHSYKNVTMIQCIGLRQNAFELV